MEKKLTIQAVSAVITNTEGITRSTTYKRSSRRTRSVGVYAKVRGYNGEIILDYCTHGSEYATKRSKVEIPKAIEKLESKGFKVVTKEEPFMAGSKIMNKVLVVELA